MMRSGNPALKDDTFNVISSDASDRMTVGGTVNKTAALLVLCGATGYYAWQHPEVMRWYLLWTFGGLALGMVTIFKRTWAPVLAPLYALVQGLMVGSISMVMERSYPGIVLQAVTLTFGVLGALLLVYKSGLIKVTENFRLGVAAATGGIMLIYLISFVMSFFGKSIPLIHQSGTVGILFSLFVVAIAALNLVMDFDFIEQGADRGAPKYMEWYGAFGLIVTLIWLYLEILRLLSKSRSRR